VAAILVGRMGAEAMVYAENRAEQALKGNKDVCAWCVWRSVRAAVRELLRTAAQGDTVN
jgi:hypothetical protein